MIELVLLAVIAVADHVPNAMPAVVASRYAKNFSAVAVQKSFPVPVPQAGEVLVEVLASSINPIDWKVLDGALKDIFPLTFPQILGCDFVGRVVRAGALPQGALSQGALVWGDLGAGASEGAYAAYVAVSASKVGLLAPPGGALPAGFNATALATLPLVGKTMWQSLELGRDNGVFARARAARNGSVVLVTSGGGGTGTAGVQLAKAFGASHVITTGHGAEELALLRSLGADRVLDWASEDVMADSVLANNSVDMIIDNFGYGADAAVAKVRAGGVFVSLTHALPTKPKAGVSAFATICNASRHDDLDDMLRLVRTRALRPVMQREVAAKDVTLGFREGLDGGFSGKIGVTLDW